MGVIYLAFIKSQEVLLAAVIAVAEGQHDMISCWAFGYTVFCSYCLRPLENLMNLDRIQNLLVEHSSEGILYAYGRDTHRRIRR